MTLSQQYFSTEMWLAHDGYSVKPHTPKTIKTTQEFLQHAYAEKA